MAHNDQPAIQNSTGICFYCNGKLVDVAPIEAWAVKSGETLSRSNVPTRIAKA
jgi:hypothetical protein